MNASLMYFHSHIPAIIVPNLMQTTHTLVMIRPDHFGFNPQTAATNVFQHQPTESEETIKQKALHEFAEMTKTLRLHSLSVLELSSPNIITPDAVFPNNWFSHHEKNTLILYPMLAPNRRAERQPNELINLLKENNIPDPKIIDLTAWENSGNILEGTGSLVLDRVNKIAYAMDSPRTTKTAFEKWCQTMNYEGLLFHAYDKDKVPVYHTNVLMSVGNHFAVVCFESMQDAQEKELLRKKLQETNKTIIDISIQQMFQFCGNILEVKTLDKKPAIILSETAHYAFTSEQKNTLSQFGEFIVTKIPTIESIGGGSARCMVAEIFA